MKLEDEKEFNELMKEYRDDLEAFGFHKNMIDFNDVELASIKNMLKWIRKQVSDKTETMPIELFSEHESYTFEIDDRIVIDFIRSHLDRGEDFDVFFPEYEINVSLDDDED